MGAVRVSLLHLHWRRFAESKCPDRALELRKEYISVSRPIARNGIFERAGVEHARRGAAVDSLTIEAAPSVAIRNVENLLAVRRPDWIDIRARAGGQARSGVVAGAIYQPDVPGSGLGIQTVGGDQIVVGRTDRRVQVLHIV